MTFLGRYRCFGNFFADTVIDSRYINLLTIKFCHYYLIKLTLKASLISLQTKTIVNTSHTMVLFNKKTNQKYNDLAINSQERSCLL